MAVSAITALFAHPKKSITGDDIAAYTAGVDAPSSVRGIKAYSVTGQLVRQWQMRFDAGSILNVDNEPLNPDEVYDALQQIKAENLMLTMIDNSGSVWRDQTETVDVKIEQLELKRTDKQDPGHVIAVVTEVV